MKERVKTLICKSAIFFAENTVGKSYPIFTYAPKVPDSLLKSQRIENNRKNIYSQKG